MLNANSFAESDGYDPKIPLYIPPGIMDQSSLDQSYCSCTSPDKSYSIESIPSMPNMAEQLNAVEDTTLQGLPPPPAITRSNDVLQYGIPLPPPLYRSVPDSWYHSGTYSVCPAPPLSHSQPLTHPPLITIQELQHSVPISLYQAQTPSC